MYLLYELIKLEYKDKRVLLFKIRMRDYVCGDLESFSLVLDMDQIMVDVHSRRCGLDVGIYKCLLFAW